MKKLVCELCGNQNFIMEYRDKVICKCGLVLRVPDVNVKASQRLKAEIILQVSLLKREIDKCLDNRDKERFQKLSSRLILLHEILNTEFLLMDIYKKMNSIALD